MQLVPIKCTGNHYIVHMHVHNNVGLKNESWGKHLPITMGEIDFETLPIKADNVIEVAEMKY